ncbi:MAG: hypothetical protein ABH869_04375, partial [Candidatus Omnitrophota bacterium]
PRQSPEVGNRNKDMVFATMAQMAFSFRRNFLTLFFELFKVLNELALISKEEFGLKHHLTIILKKL